MQSRIPSENTIIALAAILFVVIVLTFADWREGWMDEFVTYKSTDPTQSVLTLYRNYWADETHAPTYYLVLWVWRKITAPLPGLFAARLFSFSVSVCLSVIATYAYATLVRGRVAVFAVLLLTSPVLLLYAEEARSYVLSFFGGVFLGIMFLASLSRADNQQTQLVGAVLAGAFGGLLCSVHLVSVATASFVLFVLTALAAWHRLWWVSLFTVAIVVLVLIPGAASTLMLTSGVQAGTRNAWIHRRDALEAVIWFPAFLGLPSLVIIAMLGDRKLNSTLYTDQNLRPAVYALAAALAFVFLAVAIAVVKPVLVLRYLATCAGFMLPATTMIAEKTIAKVAPRYAKFAVAVVVTCFVADAAAAMVLPVRSGNWRAPGRYIQSLPGCRNSIIPVLVSNLEPSEGVARYFSFMFAWYSSNPERFVPATLQNLDDNATLPCPIRLWAVHQRDFSQAAFDAVVRTCRREATDVLKFDAGYLLVALSDPKVADQWTGARTTCAKFIEALSKKRH
jgi:hypothetical protein